MQEFNLNSIYNNVYSAYSADGSLFVVVLARENVTYPGKNSPNIFEALVLRSTDGGKSFERIPIEDSPKGQFNVSIEPEGMFLTYDVEGKKARRVQVPGFVNPLAGKVGSIQITAPPVVQQITDPAILYRLQQLEARVAALEKRPTIVQGVTEQRAAEIAWQKANDAVWAMLHDSNSPLMSIMWQKIMDGVFLKTGK